MTMPKQVSGMCFASPASRSKVSPGETAPRVVVAALAATMPPINRKIAALVTPWLSRWTIEAVRPATESKCSPSVM